MLRHLQGPRWKYAGCHVDASVRVEADDAAGSGNLARSLVRAPSAADRLQNRAREGTVVYRFLAALEGSPSEVGTDRRAGRSGATK